jgi:hypothetical protein
MNSEIKFVHVKMSQSQSYLHATMLHRGAGEVGTGTAPIHFQVTLGSHGYLLHNSC